MSRHLLLVLYLFYPMLSFSHNSQINSHGFFSSKSKIVDMLSFLVHSEQSNGKTFIKEHVLHLKSIHHF